MVIKLSLLGVYKIVLIRFLLYCPYKVLIRCLLDCPDKCLSMSFNKLFLEAEGTFQTCRFNYKKKAYKVIYLLK